MPVWKAALVALAAGPLMSATVPPTHLAPGELYPQVLRVRCDEGSGSAFAIRGGNLISVNHVTRLSNCSVNGAPVEATPEPDLDFSVVKSATPNGFKVNCKGFTPWRWVFAVGFARGYEWQTMVRLYATPWKDKSGKQVLLGPPTVIPGMSGGIVMDENGEALGTVNAFYDGGIASLSRPLADTSLCRATVAAGSGAPPASGSEADDAVLRH